MATTIPVIKQNGKVITECYLGSTIVIELPNDNVNYDHDIYYGLSGQTFKLAEFVGNSYTWKIPLDLATLLPNTTNGRFTIRVETYENYSLIGSKNAVITVKVPENITPTALENTYTETISGLTDKFGGWVQDNSILDITINASGQYGASIIQCVTEFMGKTYTGLKFRTDVLNKSGTHTIKTTVTDSRGRKLVINDSLYILPYTFPKIGALRAYRCDRSGAKRDEGEYVRVEYEYTVNVMNNNNVGSFAIKYAKAGETNFTNLSTGTGTAIAGTFISTSAILLPEYAYTIRLTVSDYVKTVNYDVDISVGFMVMDFNDNGRAIGIGKASEKDIGLEINMPIYDQYDTRILNGLSFYESGGSTNANTTIEELFLSTVNTPTSDFWYVRQIFYGSKTATATRIQIAEPYDKNNASHYRRVYINGSGWSAWIKTPVIVDEGTSGIWTYRKWSNGKAEVFGKIPISALAVSTALGGWYRSAVISGSSYKYPLTFASIPVVNTDYATSNGTGGMMWLTTQGTTTAPPDFYIIRPTSSAGVTGSVNVRVEGTWNL
jgi:hypothetical protein